MAARRSSDYIPSYAGFQRQKEACKEHAWTHGGLLAVYEVKCSLYSKVFQV